MSAKLGLLPPKNFSFPIFETILLQALYKSIRTSLLTLYLLKIIVDLLEKRSVILLCRMNLYIEFNNCQLCMKIIEKDYKERENKRKNN